MASGSPTCARCGRTNSDFNVFCSACGALLRRDSTRPPSVRLPERDAAVADLAPGTRVDRFQIEACIGRGAVGVVYRARDLEDARSVALKFLAAELLSDEQAKSRFLREARALSALDHPNVGAILSLAEHEGRPFLVLGLYEGETLRERVERGRVHPAEVVEILGQLAHGLHAAHQAGIVHRDVKPANVILTAADRRAVLVDFGLAKLLVGLRPGSMLTQAGAVLGTVAYMAPEQIGSDSVDHRVDLWSLGVIGYEAVTGKHPFVTSSRATTASRVFSHSPPPACSVCADVPEALSDLLASLMAKAPQDRIPTAAEVARRLAAIA